MRVRLQADRFVWNLVLEAYASEGDVVRFEEVLRDMRQRNYPRTHDSYALELQAHLANHDATAVVLLGRICKSMCIEFVAIFGRLDSVHDHT